MQMHRNSWCSGESDSPDDTVGKDMAYENAGIQNGENVGNRLAVIGLKKKDFTGIEEHILRLSLCLSNISHR
jgi:hypothetical protein